MSWSEWLISAALVAVVVRQLRGRRLTVVGLCWPVGLVLVASAEYLRGLPTEGAGLVLVVAAGTVGAALGVGCGHLTRLWRTPEQAVVAKATGLAALLWVVGMSARAGFALFAEHGGQAEIASFSSAHALTGAAWTDGLLLMALAEVLGRTSTLAWRLRAMTVRT